MIMFVMQMMVQRCNINPFCPCLHIYVLKHETMIIYTSLLIKSCGSHFVCFIPHYKIPSVCSQWLGVCVLRSCKAISSDSMFVGKFSVGCQTDLSLFSHLMVMTLLMTTCVHESSVTVITNSLDHHLFPGCLDDMFVCLTRVWPLTTVITEPVAVCVSVCECGHGILRMTL